ncbi:hypothetical protein BU15DRAFT_17924, partial [Melanogaster broomeanus]
YQNGRTVRDFFSELTEIWNMIGDVHHRDRVMNLWTGLRKEIQELLWQRELSPEVSSLTEVRDAAERIEISHGVYGSGR